MTVFLGLLASNCGQSRTDAPYHSGKNETVDSIFRWIDQGRNSHLDRNARIDYLTKAEKSVDKLYNDSVQTVLTSKISYSYLKLKDSLRFNRLNLKTISLAQKRQDSVIWAEALWDRAIFFNNRALPDSAFYNYSKAQKIYERLDRDFESARMLYNMAITQAAVRDYTGSEINTIRAIEILKPLKKAKQLYLCYNNLGSVTKELKEFERAIEYYKTAFEYQEQIETENHFDSSLNNNIGVVYQEQGRYEESLPYFEKVLEKKSFRQSDPKLYALALNHWAYSKFKSDPKVDVADDIERSIRLLDSINNIPGLARAYYNLAEFNLTQKDTLQALAFAKKSKEYAKQANNNERILLDLQLMAKLEPEKSSAYTKEYITLNDSLQQVERQVRNKFARIRFETDEFIAENLLLARQKQLWTGIAVAVLLLGIMSYFILDQRVKNQKLRFQQEQQAANQEIFNLMLAQNQKVEEGKKLEQKRISEELHDGVLGRMLGARMVLTGLNKKQDEASELQRKKAIDALQDVEKEIRAISHELSHAAYQKINNFIRSIEDLLETVQVSGKFNYTFDYNKDFDWDGIKGVTKINIYRLIQESLQNCVKHAQCENVWLNLDAGGNELRVTVTDDGKGFAKKKGKKGIGMRNMASRIEKLNGQWHIESAPGKGTKVWFKVPIATPQNTKVERPKEEELT
ncbi:tetratricopeptide repeat-containing sensor histidine kinase [Pseudozobellia thermophila]|uniref:tetratricopeptide repeat-containing sensor histidine kinase n=1 Tax=Pseudozobellia thermophila TaxID=192903 RepID=UPI000932F4AA|nr:tetratricopeptide repeat protein [Pseudozobellia thermophila]